MAIARTVAIEQGKGGVGKTSLVANVGGLAAAAGVRTLIVDLDPQGNIARDLGFPPSDGQALFNAFATGGSLPVLKDVRPNLDVCPAGQPLATSPDSTSRGSSAAPETSECSSSAPSAPSRGSTTSSCSIRLQGTG